MHCLGPMETCAPYKDHSELCSDGFGTGYPPYTTKARIGFRDIRNFTDCFMHASRLLRILIEASSLFRKCFPSFPSVWLFFGHVKDSNMADCCLKGFRWNANPKGREDVLLAGTSCYITGPESPTAILILHDLYGWTFQNTRLLADHYVEEIGATVYVPDLQVLLLIMRILRECLGSFA